MQAAGTPNQEQKMVETLEIVESTLSPADAIEELSLEMLAGVAGGGGNVGLTI
jgi:hypothetical protein